MHFRLLLSQLIRPVRFTTPSLLLLDPPLPRGNAGLLLVPRRRSPRNERRNPLRILPGARLCLGSPGKFLLLVFLVSLFLFFILTLFFFFFFSVLRFLLSPVVLAGLAARFGSRLLRPLMILGFPVLLVLPLLQLRI